MMNQLLSQFADRCSGLRQQIEMMDAGKLKTGERTLARPAWTDTTAQSRQTAADHLTQYETLIARHAQA